MQKCGFICGLAAVILIAGCTAPRVDSLAGPSLAGPSVGGPGGVASTVAAGGVAPAAAAAGTDQGLGDAAAARRAALQSAEQRAGAAGAVSSPPPGELVQRLEAELAAADSLDPAARQRLLEDFRATDPAIQPRLLESVRASLAYRGQAGARPAPQAVALERAAGEAAVPVVPASGSDEKAPPALPRVDAKAEVVAPSHAPHDEDGPTEGRRDGEEREKADKPATHAGGEVGQTGAAWPGHLDAAISAMEVQLAEGVAGPEQQARLKLLYLAAGSREKAVEPLAGVPPAEQDYWSKQLFALGTWLDSRRIADGDARAAATSRHLSEAAAALGELSPLVVKNLVFANEVTSYGVYTRLEEYVFEAGEQVLLYAEVDCFKSDQTPQGYHTALASRYQIFDSQGRRVAHDDFALSEEHCQNRRRDYFIRYFLWLPERIYPGNYTLELTIEDTLAKKIGQSTIAFSVE